MLKFYICANYYMCNVMIKINLTIKYVNMF